MVEATINDLREIGYSTWVRKTIVVSVELEIFSKIKQGANTAQKLAESLNTRTEGVERLLNACVSLGYLKKQGKVYQNTEVSGRFLIKGSPDYYGDFLIMNDRSGRGWDILKDCILKGCSSEERIVNFEDPLFTRAMHNNAVLPARLLSERLDFSKYKNLLDIGGGSGAYPIVITDRHKNLKATIFELPKACETAREYVQASGDNSRIDIFEGDFLRDRLPEGFDVVLVSQIFHSFDVEDCKTLIKKIYDILPKEGVIIVNEFLLDKDKTGPVFSALFSLNMFIRSKGGSSYTKEEIIRWLKEAGFDIIDTIHLVGPTSSIIAKKV